ncbi:hypothetical protein BDW02DRAFT_557683 [Decorospora gaudefroyi]|uniref:Uncharacterized protein n=1 Tax=Decorospora gaudefroyi TaxID=184978 RepID=A0A6A5K9E7_9PLEO|nr:hypothetical protein BDW02DRAFT_557683 [Decorospora gaudefroyi]
MLVSISPRFNIQTSNALFSLSLSLSLWPHFPTRALQHPILHVFHATFLRCYPRAGCRSDHCVCAFTNNAQVETRLTALPSARPKVPQPATTAARRATLAVNAPLPRRRRLATVAVVLATSPASAPRTAVPRWVAAAAVAKNATSAASRVTLPATAPRVADMVAVLVATAAVVEATVAALVATAVLARLLATRAVVLVT